MTTTNNAGDATSIAAAAAWPANQPGGNTGATGTFQAAAGLVR